MADGFIATGGINPNNDQVSSSVEVFSYKYGWNLEPRLNMSSAKYGHCSITIGSWLYTIGGLVFGTKTTSHIANLVEAIDITVESGATWIRKADMLETRYVPGCHLGVFEGQEGIYVAGGHNDNDPYLSSAEFYDPVLDIWQEIASMTTRRGFSSMTILGRDLIVSGGLGDGYDYLSSVEIWNGTKWVELDDQRLEMGRTYNAAVSIKAGVLSCI